MVKLPGRTQHRLRRPCRQRTDRLIGERIAIEIEVETVEQPDAKAA